MFIDGKARDTKSFKIVYRKKSATCTSQHL